jgi:rhodanese-related sulfurtransferase
MKKIWFPLMALVAFTLAACSGVNNALNSGSDSKGTYQDISVRELQSMFENKDFVFVNVHIPFEGDIPDTDLSIPYNEIEQNLEKLPADKDAKIVLYCRSGNMSSIAAETLADLGYTNVSNLEGGFNAWDKAGLPLEGQ